MVLFDDLINPEKFLNLQLIKRGAESEIRLGYFLSTKAIYKIRVKKIYMNDDLDKDLRYDRTRREAKILATAYLNRINVPKLYAVYPSVGLIIMEYIEGNTLKDLFLYEPEKYIPFSYFAGIELAKIHKANIIHNDYTTSNIIVRDEKVFVIDFGLSDYSTSIEDKAVDIHLYKRAVESTHASISEKIMKEFIRGYLKETGEEIGNKIIKRAKEIELRGRYVGERRTVWKT
ncbi:Kae1-associated kinase Bud32 [Caldisphaera lagunensis DSM 15908]|uniref:non-specific serine/threonine protein kinase n=1 Tax=Caldisphaera lagunensis (strain DSM 15908 / JCM 11604 / ANMR 0165 / IC-154) TaxID=1056495 RepID=L0A847_CALLD|nr:Kae1-associated kinase Bud32 [Caldisphaera lagunensis]AFZ70006.1 Kae1-associated kinase Bud32 [Caldisphaera lagunensis DSM 15908]